MTGSAHSIPTADFLYSPFSPPWEIIPKDGKFCVTVQESGEELKCHETEEQAKAHMRALYANVQEAAMQSFGFIGSSVYHIELFGNDGDIARRALNGDPILIMPLENFYDHWGELREINDQVAEQFIDNWNHRLDRGIRREKLAVDINHKGGAVGWYKDITLLKGLGVGASFDWTKKGREALESGEWAYFSPTVYWKVRDRTTGQIVENQVAGGALTNYPYFGEETALMSQPFLPRSISGGFDMADQDTVTLNADEITGFRRVLSLFGGQPGSDQAPPAGNGQQVDPSVIEDMSNRLTTMEGTLSEVTQERDEYRDQVGQLQNRLGTVEIARQQERFTHMATSEFSHLPGDVAQLSAGLMWMFNAEKPDDEGKRPHFEYFTEILRRADASFAEAFDSVGTGAGQVGDDQARIDQAIAKYQEDHPDVSYEDASAAVFAARPDLAALFNASLPTPGGA